MRGSGDYALHGGAERRVLGVGPDYLRLQLPREELDTYDAPGVLDRREEPPPVGGSVKVTKASVQRLVRRNVRGRWRGTDVTLRFDDGQRLQVDVLGPPELAEAAGLSGDRRDGWHGWVARDEVTDIEETERELPVVIREPRP